MTKWVDSKASQEKGKILHTFNLLLASLEQKKEQLLKEFDEKHGEIKERIQGKFSEISSTKKGIEDHLEEMQSLLNTKKPENSEESKEEKSEEEISKIENLNRKSEKFLILPSDFLKINQVIDLNETNHHFKNFSPFYKTMIIKYL
jgi:hypothetical protein